VDSKAEYSALSSTRSRQNIKKKKLKQTRKKFNSKLRFDPHISYITNSAAGRLDMA